jgi:hypothetical protein
VDTKSPDFNELRNNLEKTFNRPKEDLKNSRAEIRQSSKDEKKPQASRTPNSEAGSKPSGGQRQSWVLASSTPQTKPFDDQKSGLDESEEKPREVSKTQAPEDDSKIYRVKDNPYVKGSSPNKTVSVAKKSESQEPAPKKVVTESKVANIKEEK